MRATFRALKLAAWIIFQAGYYTGLMRGRWLR